MLTRLYAHNYRCFVNFELRPPKQALLLGYNGSGKTSVFDVLEAIQDLVVNHTDVRDALPADTVSWFGNESAQRFELEASLAEGTFRYALVVDHAGVHPRIASEEVVFELPDGRGLDRIYRYGDGRVTLTGSDDPLDEHEFPFAPERSYLSSVDRDRANPRLLRFLEFVSNIFILRLDPMNTGSFAGKEEPFLLRDGTNFAGWMRHIMLESRDKVEAAEHALRGVFPGFHGLALQAAGRGRVLVVKVRVGGRTRDVEFDLLSDGQRVLIVLYVVLAVVREWATVLCLDEPDNFVAIREIQPFLVELADAADEGALQSIVISHGSEVIDFIGPSGAVFLERPEAGVVRTGRVVDSESLKLSELMARGWVSSSGGADV